MYFIVLASFSSVLLCVLGNPSWFISGCSDIFCKITLLPYFYLSKLLLNINFSSRTTSMDVQRNLEANVEKRTKDTYGPPMGKRLLVFMDDMNMPQVNLVSMLLI